MEQDGDEPAVRRSHVERGRLGEALAATFLELRGYRVVDRNVRVGHLELDLVARRGNLIVFVEVKYRRHTRAGGAAAAVGRRKQLDLETAAVAYLQRRQWRRNPVRFDVVALEYRQGEPEALTVRHLVDAYRASGRYRA